jgi:hypothetical protein
MSVAYEASFPRLIVISEDGRNILREKKNSGQTNGKRMWLEFERKKKKFK